jgi:hypothetical protein
MPFDASLLVNIYASIYRITTKPEPEYVTVSPNNPTPTPAI